MDSKKSYYLNITTESTIQDITILFISQSCDYHIFFLLSHEMNFIDIIDNRGYNTIQ